MNFGEAILALKSGGRVSRAGWNGKGMWLALVTHWTFNVFLHGEDNKIGELSPFIVMRTADIKFVPWLASQTDILAEDWGLVSLPEN